MALRLVDIRSFYEYKYAYPGSGPAGPGGEGVMGSKGAGGTSPFPLVPWP